MVVSSDASRQSSMQAHIEEALKRAGDKPGAPGITIGAWSQGREEPELRVVVGGKPRVLEVSRNFLEDEPDSDALTKVSLAATQLVEGEAPRVQLFHRGVYVAWPLTREPN